MSFLTGTKSCHFRFQCIFGNLKFKKKPKTKCEIGQLHVLHFNGCFRHTKHFASKCTMENWINKKDSLIEIHLFQQHAEDRSNARLGLSTIGQIVNYSRRDYESCVHIILFFSRIIDFMSWKESNCGALSGRNTYYLVRNKIMPRFGSQWPNFSPFLTSVHINYKACVNELWHIQEYILETYLFLEQCNLNLFLKLMQSRSDRTMQCVAF